MVEILKIKYLGSINEYLSLTMAFIVAFGLCFQLPVLLTLLGKVGLISPVGLANRKYAVVAILIVAALVTPRMLLLKLFCFPLFIYFMRFLSFLLGVLKLKPSMIKNHLSNEPFYNRIR